MKLGKKIAMLRKKEKITQEKMADKLGISRQTISNWELDVTKPDIEQIIKIAKMFKISIDDLLDNKTNDIMLAKIQNTEKLVNKNFKAVKYLAIIIYFILLTSSMFTIIYFATKKDFTTDYQVDFSCSSETFEVKVELIPMESVPESLRIDDGMYLQTYEKEQYEEEFHEGETYYVGKSLSDILASVREFKNFVIDYYGVTCR